jgi:hypothetical protein
MLAELLEIFTEGSIRCQICSDNLKQSVQPDNEITGDDSPAATVRLIKAGNWNVEAGKCALNGA